MSNATGGQARHTTHAIDVQRRQAKEHALRLALVQLLERVLAVGENGDADVEVQIQRIGNGKVRVCRERQRARQRRTTAWRGGPHPKAEADRRCTSQRPVDASATPSRSRRHPPLLPQSRRTDPAAWCGRASGRPRRVREGAGWRCAPLRDRQSADEEKEERKKGGRTHRSCPSTSQMQSTCPPRRAHT